jgi:hypothetical protein
MSTDPDDLDALGYHDEADEQRLDWKRRSGDYDRHRRDDEEAYRRKRAGLAQKRKTKKPTSK